MTIYNEYNVPDREISDKIWKAVNDILDMFPDENPREICAETIQSISAAMSFRVLETGVNLRKAKKAAELRGENS